MPARLGPLAAEITLPESERYTAPAVLVHGLWARAAAWRRFAGYLAHRGWRCIALERREQAAGVAAHIDDLRAALVALENPPVLLGHDLGANLALACADVARAVVALAPLTAGAPGLAQAGTWFSRWRGAPLRPPGGRWRGAYARRDLTEPAALIAEAAAGAPRLAARGLAAPCTIVAMEQDTVTPPTAATALASQLGIEAQTIVGVGHAVLTDPGWETVVGAAHRWIVQRLGVDLLALYDEAMNPE